MNIIRLLLVLPAAVALAHADPLKGLIYEATFNASKKSIEIINGASLGGPGTGVSGKPGDCAYVNATKTTKNERNGPVALALYPIMPDAQSAFTVAFWYYLDDQGPELQVPLSAAGILILMHERGFEVRIENQTEQPRAYIFTTGPNGPYLGWRDRQCWIFVAFTWKQTTNTLSVYQGTPTKAVVLARDLSRPTPANPTLPRVNLDRDPETIGNTFLFHDRPFAGRMDDVRVYDRAVDITDLETIRQADLANELPGK